MTPAARQAVAKRMKKYWADRRRQATSEGADVGHRYPKKQKGRPRLINKEGRVIAQ